MLPSTTNRFLTSWVWPNALVTEVFGSFPMRAVPSSWIDQPSVSTSVAHADVLGAGGLEHLSGRLGHVLGHLHLVVAEAVVEPQHRDAPRVLRDRVELDLILAPRQDLAERGEVDRRRMICRAPFCLNAEPNPGVVCACAGYSARPLPPCKP